MRMVFRRNLIRRESCLNLIVNAYYMRSVFENTADKAGRSHAGGSRSRRSGDDALPRYHGDRTR